MNYYDSNADAGDSAVRPHGWAGRNWSPAIGAEHEATRTYAGLFDETSFAKISVRGPDSSAFLERVCDNRVARRIGAVTYTQTSEQPWRHRGRRDRDPDRRRRLPSGDRDRVRRP